MNPSPALFLSATIVYLAVSTPLETQAQDWQRVIAKLERAGAKARKEQLPIAYNNFAIELSRRGEWKEAAGYLEKAVSIAPQDRQLKRNLAELYLQHALQMSGERQGSSYQQHNQARRLAERALLHDDTLAAAHVLLGDIAYRNQDLRRAKLSWTRAQRLDPGLDVVNERLVNLETEYSVEKHFGRGGNAYFDLRYQDGINSAAAALFEQTLVEARKKVGNDFKYWPRHKIVVLIYSPEAFEKIRPGPDWVAGIYDGKIRVPLPSSRAAAGSIEPTLYHEYTHALIHDLTRNNCPVWLNEGIAEYEESKVRPPSLSLLRTAARIDRLVPFEKLEAAFRSEDPRVAGLAYEQSFSVVTYLVNRHGVYRVRRVLDLLAEGSSIDEAFRKELRMSSAQFESRWKSWLPSLVR